MREQDRRGFLQWLTGGVLCLMPASLLAQQDQPGNLARRAVPIDDDFSRVLKGTTKANHVQVLKASKLTQEQQLAIATVRELPPREVESVAAKLRGKGDLGSDKGGFCGAGCGGGGGDVGTICGAGCGTLVGKAQAVVDPQGLLKLNMKDLNRAAALDALDKAVALTKTTAPATR
jgi:outer membrane lipoprotein SlyB